MKTVFPVPLEDITAQLLRVGRWEGELIHTRRDGSRLTLSSRWSLQRDRRGRPVATMETNNDITERNQAQEALRRTQAELAHLNRVMTLGELTASIARGQPAARRHRHQRRGLPALARPQTARAGRGARRGAEHDRRRHARERSDPADSRALRRPSCRRCG